ncbi:MAG: hypothetical protein LUH02_04400 [Erysipelotrichaceae bacterium]|nr:hypothetical protein [Erysipelotrichaceae bacterium]
MKYIETYFNEFQSIYQVSPKSHILIIGAVGTGKTTLTDMIVNYLCQDKPYHVERDNETVKLSYDKETIIIDNTLEDNDDTCIKIYLPNINHETFMQLLKEELEKNKESIQQGTLDNIHQYALYICQQPYFKNIYDIKDLVKKMQNNRIQKYHKDIIDASCLPKEIQEYIIDEFQKETLLKETLKEIDYLIRKEPIEEFIQDFIYTQKINQEMKQRNIPTQPLPIIFITGNRGSGKTTVARLLSKIYYALSLTSQKDYIQGNPWNFSQLIEKAYQSQSLFVLDLSIRCSYEQLQILNEYYHKGLKIIMMAYSAKEYPQFNKKILHLPDFSSNELYDIFEQICDNNRISISTQAVGAIKTKFVNDEIAGLIPLNNAIQASMLFGKINIQRYRRNSVPYYEITLEDVLDALKNK